jgi:topoisomerase-4 subunit B
MIDAGKIYIALPPLYKLQKGAGAKTKIEYAWTNEELDTLSKTFGKGGSLQRFKGLGEMNADQLWDTTMNPDTRTLIRVRIEDAALAERRVTTLMGDKVEPRRKWIEDNVQFTLEEAGSILDTTQEKADAEAEEDEMESVEETLTTDSKPKSKSSEPTITTWDNSGEEQMDLFNE